MGGPASGPLRVVLATRNAGKVAELARILGPAVTLLGLGDVPAYDEPAETGDTFAENALIKARAAVAATGLAAVADDSGLAVDALNGMPGIFSARWAGRHGDDRANLELLLAQLHDVPDERRGAAFCCAAVCVQPDGEAVVEEARWVGRIGRLPLGSGGFGYDPVFLPAGVGGRTAAELSPAEKDALSHRGKAFRLLARQLG